MQWLTSINVVLSVFAEVPPYSVQAVTTGLFPLFVDAKSLLQYRKANLKFFFSAESKTAPCIMCPEISALF